MFCNQYFAFKAGIVGLIYRLTLKQRITSQARTLSFGANISVLKGDTALCLQGDEGCLLVLIPLSMKYYNIRFPGPLERICWGVNQPQTRLQGYDPRHA